MRRLACCTPLAPQVDRLFYDDVLRVADVGDRTVPIEDQVAAARDAVPDLDLASVKVSDDPAATTMVTFVDPALTDHRQEGGQIYC